MLAVDSLKPTAAAVVACVALRDVDRAIDAGIFPEGFFSIDDGWQVAAVACTLIAFDFESVHRLAADERRFAIRTAGMRLRGNLSGGMTSRPLANSREELFDDIAGLALAQHPRFAQLTLIAFA